MAFSPLSFLLGVGAAYLVPVISRNFRPIAVEAAALGMGLLEDLRRVVAEQMENAEDIAAEARARREQTTGAAVDIGVEAEDEEAPDAGDESPARAPAARAPRRHSRRSRPRAS
jgi:hypothetical protein